MNVPPMAACTNPDCGEPLVSTFHRAKYEFVCVCCGRKLGLESGVDLDEWLGHRSAPR